MSLLRFDLVWHGGEKKKLQKNMRKEHWLQENTWVTPKEEEVTVSMATNLQQKRVNHIGKSEKVANFVIFSFGPQGNATSSHEFCETCHSVTFYFMKKDSKR